MRGCRDVLRVDGLAWTWHTHFHAHPMNVFWPGRKVLRVCSLDLDTGLCS